jgi:geranylgeranyl pyrophosphate synthase
MKAQPNHETLRALLNGNPQDEPSLDSLIEEIRTSPAIEQSMDEARSFVVEGQRVLDVLPDEEIRQTLARLAAFIVERDR